MRAPSWCDIWNDHSHCSPNRSNAQLDILDIVETRDLVLLMHLTNCFAFSSNHLPFLVDTMSSITFSRQYSWPLLRTRPYSRLASGNPAIREETSVDKRFKDNSRRILAAFIIRLHSAENTTAEPTTENTTAEPSKGTADIQQLSRPESSGEPPTVVCGLLLE
jgi:hypothetical protein